MKVSNDPLFNPESLWPPRPVERSYQSRYAALVVICAALEATSLQQTADLNLLTHHARAMHRAQRQPAQAFYRNWASIVRYCLKAPLTIRDISPVFSAQGI